MANDNLQPEQEPEIDGTSIWKDFFTNHEAWSEERIRVGESNKAHFLTSEEPLGWDKKERSKLMRLDIAIAAIHLANARLFAKTLPAIFETRYAATKRGWVEKGVNWIAQKILGSELMKTMNRLTVLIDLWDNEKLMIEVEQGIRRAHIRTLKEAFQKAVLPRKVRQRGRRTKLVSTRHKTERQRKRNTSWKSPRPK